MTQGMTFGHRLETLAEGVTAFADGEPRRLPLSDTRIAVEVTSGLALVVATRRFANRENVAIEAILTMPVGFEAVVTGLEAEVDGRRLRATAQAKEAARATYESAQEEGRLAILHEEALRGIHVLSIGPLGPGQEVAVELRMVLPLVPSEGGPFLRLPMTAGQLYGATPLMPADDLATSRDVRHEAVLTVRTDAGEPLLAGHRLQGETRVTLDRALEITVAGGRFGAVTGTSAEGHLVRLDLREQGTGPQPLRLGILVDRSGSTANKVGDRSVLKAITEGLGEALHRQADQGDHIALWQFSDNCRRIGTGRGAEVTELLPKISPPGGGTQLAKAIARMAKTGLTDILVLTDGQTWDALGPLAALPLRISAVLVGSASLDANIGRLCAETGGDLHYAPEAEVAPGVMRALRGFRAPGQREIDLADGTPRRVLRALGGVEITASWSEAMELRGSDLGRYAAGLCLGLMPPEAATALALREGLCSATTSLVLVDEAGAAAEGEVAMRKVPLMGSFEDVPPMHASGLSPSPSRLDGVRLMLRDSPTDGVEPPRKRPVAAPKRFPPFRLARIAGAIDWEGQAEAFLTGDFTGLMEEEATLLDEMLADDAILDVVRDFPGPKRLVLLAWLAWRYVKHSAAARDLAEQVLGRMPDDSVIRDIDGAILEMERVE